MIDRTTETWRDVSKWAEGRLATHRSRLQTLGLPIDETEGLRHAIQELNELLNLQSPNRPKFADPVEP